MTPLWHLIIGFSVSFVGSIPPGTLNLQVINLSISKGSKESFWFSLGASLLELVYAGIAIYLTKRINFAVNILFYMQVLALPVLACLSISYLKNTHKQEALSIRKHGGKGNYFFQGLFRAC